jgi:hypothetical protein
LKTPGCHFIESSGVGFQLLKTKEDGKAASATTEKEFQNETTPSHFETSGVGLGGGVSIGHEVQATSIASLFWA